MIGTITLKLDGASLVETERCREIIHTLFAMGVFGIRNGHATLSFDHEGTLQEVRHEFIKWRKGKAVLPALADFKDVTIEASQ